VQGREKDQINRGGEKIAAEEIENLLLRHPAVIHAALVSMEDSLLGEKLRVSGGERAAARGRGAPLPARTGRRRI
jgi:acyl-CoA synthetase (AMP-forming)/AMP-acid ligase II